MEDRVGSEIPSEREVDAIVDMIHAIGKRIQRFTIMLSRDGRLAALRFRPGGEPIIETIGKLATEHGVALPKISVSGMNDDLLLAQRLAPIAKALAPIVQRVDDTILEARAESWWAGTAFYTSLARMASLSPELEEALRPVVEFFATGPRKGKAGNGGDNGGNAPTEK